MRNTVIEGTAKGAKSKKTKCQNAMEARDYFEKTKARVRNLKGEVFGETAFSFFYKWPESRTKYKVEITHNSKTKP